MVECLICNKQFKVVNSLHLRNHNCSVDGYIAAYPAAILYSDDIKTKMSNSIKLTWHRDSDRVAGWTEYLKTHPHPCLRKKFPNRVISKPKLTLEGLESLRKHGRRLGLSCKGRKHTEEEKLKMSTALKGRSYEELMGKEKADRLREDRRKCFDIHNNRMESDPEYNARCTWARTRNIKPTKPERELDEILQMILPNTFSYNGNYKLGVSLGRRIPDFVNINDKKQVIELFGDYYHRNDSVKNKMKHYKKLGFDCLVVWENELKADRVQLINKLLAFEGGKK